MHRCAWPEGCWQDADVGGRCYYHTKLTRGTIRVSEMDLLLQQERRERELERILTRAVRKSEEGSMETEPLTEVLHRLWNDTLTLREADPAEVAAAKDGLTTMDADHVARLASVDQMAAEIRDLHARAEHLRGKLER